MLEFPVSEYEARIGKLVANMKLAGMDGVMLTSMENTRYYTGLQSVIWPSKLSTPGIVLVNASGEVYIVGSASAQDTARYSACVEDENVIHFSRNGIPGVAQTYPEAIMNTMKKMGLNNGRLGIEMGEYTRLHLQMQWMDTLTQQMSDLTFVDAAPLIWAQRTVKSAEEMKVMRKLFAINDNCYRYAFEHIELGRTTEWDVYSMFAQEAFRQHCENVPVLGVLFGEGRYLNGNCPPSADVVITNTQHAILQIDGGPMYKGYMADIIRMGVVGSLSREQQVIMDASYDAMDFLTSRIKDGVNCKELCHALDRHVAAGPGADYYRMYTWCAHGIGLDIHEPPSIATSDDVELRAGMVLSVEPIFGDEKLGVFGNEQHVLVTENGCEILSLVDTEPFVLR